MIINENNNYGATGLTLLQIALIVLKLCDVIDWSWWWVLAPTWIPLAIILLILVAFWLACRFGR